MDAFLLGVIAVLLAGLLGVLLDVRKTVKTSNDKFEATSKDLYEKHNALDKRMVHVETVHDIRGCDLPQGARA